MSAPRVKNVLVTGATSGIGRAVVDRLLAAGTSVVALGRSALHLPEVEGLSRETIDLSRLDQLPAELDRLVGRHPGIDALVLCAGRGRFGSLEQFSYAQIRDLMDLNFLANAYLCRAFVPALRRQSEIGGHVVFLGSEAALEGSHSGSVYCASKFALRGFAQALRKELASSRVAVTMVNPGMVDTSFFDQLSFEPGLGVENRLTAQQVAEAIITALSLPVTAVIDEINLSPLKRTVQKRPRKRSERH